MYTRYYGQVTGADMRGNIEDVCRDERFEQHRYHILDFSEATEFNATERDLLVNSGVLVGAAFVNHQVMIAAVVTRENIRATSGRLHALGVSPYGRRYFQPKLKRGSGLRNPVSLQGDTALPNSEPISAITATRTPASAPGSPHQGDAIQPVALRIGIGGRT